MHRLSARVGRLASRIDPQPRADFLAYARAVIAWGGSAPDEERVRMLARALERTRRRATWTALRAVADEDDFRGVPFVDPERLTAAELEEAARIRSSIDAGGLAALSDADLDLSECLRRRLEGAEAAPCLG